MGMPQELQHLDIGNKSLTGKIPFAIFNISSLRFIRLSVNRLIGSLPNGLCNHLASVEDIRLSYNYVTGKIPITMAREFLTNGVPDSIGELPSLEELYLCGNQLTAASENQLSGQIPSNLSSCRKLQSLSLSYNAFSGQIPEGIGMLPVIQVLYLGRNYLTGISYMHNTSFNLQLNSSVGNLSSKSWLIRQGKLPRDVSSLALLTSVNAGRNNLDGNIWDSFCNLSRLEILVLDGNYLHGSIPRCVGYISPKSKVFVPRYHPISRMVKTRLLMKLRSTSKSECEESKPQSKHMIRHFDKAVQQLAHCHADVPPQQCGLKRTSLTMTLFP
ncbi:hypothetical protein Cgig2_021879 [Carnegiea gigantea]|uniref:Uncharacterized protein n=1 Tax=Carnegiea gigantea TaxID=171969 RepID=A0A9Q1GXS6_9CARY|nr:hypothetical protein Cgig2_021879 [Carnegiea gigantea]